MIGNDWYLSRNLIGNGRFYTSERREAIPESARASRSGDGALSIAYFAPKCAREARALLGMKPPVTRLFFRVLEFPSSTVPQLDVVRDTPGRC